MKRFFVMLMFLLLLTGCGSGKQVDEKNMETPFRFYYCEQSDEEYGSDLGALQWELRDLGAGEHTIEDILALYLKGPVTETLKAPFPDTLHVAETVLEKGTLTVVCSKELTELLGVSRTLTAACLVHTLTQLDEVDAVKLACTGYSLQGVLSKTLTVEDFLLLDDTATSDQTTVRLYFPDAEGRYLEEETREYSFDTYEQIAPYVVRQLLEGPQEQSHQAIFPEGTRLNTLWIRDGVCEVDLSLDLIRNLPDTHQAARMTVFALVNALTELSWVDCVRIQSGGQVIRDYGGLDLSGPIYREELALDQLQDERNVDVNLLLSYTGQEKLVAVPTVISRTTGRRLEADVLNALLAYEPANGYESPIPDGVVVTDLLVSDGLCSVTFNSIFALCDTDPLQAEKAVRAVVGTLCMLDTVDQVQIFIHQAELRNADISQPISAEADWQLK